MIVLIVKEYDTYYELIKQHDHGLLAGEMASRAGNPPFERSSLRTILTAALHDLSWKNSDEQVHRLPYHFVNYPLREKLKLYKNGIDKLEKIDEYVALLTSIHYTSFLHADGPKETKQFIKHEKQRQARLRKNFPNKNIELAHKQLKMWDNFSLYVCLNKPGVHKKDEHPWFQNGIEAVAHSGETIVVDAHWVDDQTIAFSPFPFIDCWKTTIPYMIYDKQTRTIVKKTRTVSFINH